jgi:AbrB family looped-hinge helix DNA binding protein
MSKKELNNNAPPGPDAGGQSDSGCSMQSIVPIDGRGQIVLPKDIREKADLMAGDKLAVICHESDGQVCCISLIKINKFTGAVNQVLEPFLKKRGTNEE